MRTFIALELPEEFVAQTAELARVLAEHIDGRYVVRSNYHLTVAFMSELDQREVGLACEALDASAGSGPLPLTPDGLGKFGRSRNATLWMGIARDPALMAFAGKVCEGLSAREVPFEERAFLPHVTLARHACIPNAPLPDLPLPLPCQVTRLVLYRSRLDPEGAVYSPLYEVGL